MKPNPHHWLLSSAASLGLWLASALPAAEPRAPGTNAPATAPQSAANADTESSIENLVRYAMPGKAHQLLDRMAGQWDTVTRYWMFPGAEPAEAKGTSARKWILEGRFLLEELDGGNLALPFRGVGWYGYDAFEQKYTSAWVDTMSTAILANLGTYDATNDVVNFVGEYKDPWSGMKKKNRGITRFLGKDQQALELHVTQPDGQEFKMLEIVYTRNAGVLKPGSPAN